MDGRGSGRRRAEFAQTRGRIARRRVSRSYADNQRGNLGRYLLPAFKNKLIAEISPQMIESWETAMTERNGPSPVTFHRIPATLKVMLAEAHRLGLIAADTAVKVSPFQETSTEYGVPLKTWTAYAAGTGGPEWIRTRNDGRRFGRPSWLWSF